MIHKLYLFCIKRVNKWPKWLRFCFWYIMYYYNSRKYGGVDLKKLYMAYAKEGIFGVLPYFDREIAIDNYLKSLPK